MILGKPKLHPLAIPTVSTNIFGQLTCTDLKSCRQVCRAWNEVSAIFIRTSCESILFTSNPAELKRLKLSKHVVNIGPKRLADFTECLRASKKFPFGKLTIGASVIQAGNTSVLWNFFKAISPWVTDMEIWGDIKDLRLQLSSFIDKFPIEICFPLLNTFTLLLCYPSSDEENIERFFMPIIRIWKNAPRLQSLTYLVENIKTRNQQFLSQFIRSVRVAKMKRIQRLHIKGYLSQGHLQELTALALTLRSLHLCALWPDAVYAHGLRGFLESQTMTLQDISLFQWPCSPVILIDVDLEFPRMPSLKVLTVDKLFRYWTTPSTTAAVSQVDKFPSLKKVVFLGADMHDTLPYITASHGTSRKVESVSVFQFGQYAYRQNCDELPRVFPNVKKLYVPESLVEKYAVQSMLKRLVQLEELTIVARAHKYKMAEFKSLQEFGNANGHDIDILVREYFQGSLFERLGDENAFFPCK